MGGHLCTNTKQAGPSTDAGPGTDAGKPSLAKPGKNAGEPDAMYEKKRLRMT